MAQLDIKQLNECVEIYEGNSRFNLAKLVRYLATIDAVIKENEAAYLSYLEHDPEGKDELLRECEIALGWFGKDAHVGHTFDRTVFRVVLVTTPHTSMFPRTSFEDILIPAAASADQVIRNLATVAAKLDKVWLREILIYLHDDIDASKCAKFFLAPIIKHITAVFCPAHLPQLGVFGKEITQDALESAGLHGVAKMQDGLEDVDQDGAEDGGQDGAQGSTEGLFGEELPIFD